MTVAPLREGRRLNAARSTAATESPPPPTWVRFHREQSRLLDFVARAVETLSISRVLYLPARKFLTAPGHRQLR